MPPLLNHPPSPMAEPKELIASKLLHAYIASFLRVLNGTGLFYNLFTASRVSTSRPVRYDVPSFFLFFFFFPPLFFFRDFFPLVYFITWPSLSSELSLVHPYPHSTILFLLSFLLLFDTNF